MKWPIYNLSQIAERFVSGGTPNTKVQEYWTGDIPWITGADFDNGDVILGRRHITQAAIKNSATNIVPKGSILIVTRTGVGKIAIAPVDIAISQDITGIILKQNLSASYILAAIRNKMGILLAAQRGATIKGVTRKDVEDILISLPAPSEQHQIVQIVNQAEVLRKKRAEADTKAARILPALFYKMFGDPATNPREWPVVPLGDLVDIGTRLVNPNQDEYIDLPHIGGEQIEGGTGRILAYKTVRESNLRSGKFIFTEKHILYSKIRPYLNKVAFPRFSGVCSADIYPVRPKDKRITPWYIVALLQTEAFLAYAAIHSERLRMPKLNQEQLAAFRIPIPDTSLLLAFERCASDIDHTLRLLTVQSGQVTRLFSVLLHRAFTSDLTAKWREAHKDQLEDEIREQLAALERAKVDQPRRSRDQKVVM